MYAILRIVGRIVAVTGLLAGLAAGYGSGARAGTAVDLALVMAIDVSGSVDETEARLQRQGYVAAFSHPEVIAAIRSGTLGRIAVLYFEWSDYSHQSLVVDWTVIDSDTAARAFSTLLAETPISRGRRTSISGAIDFGVAQFSRSPFDGTRKVIDISGDGPNNSGPTDQKAGIAGVVVAVVGLVVILVCYSQTRNDSDQRDQMESLVLALFGLGLVILGSVMYLRNSLTRFLRFWLVRLIYEQRDLARGDERSR